jgi:DNA uptake protein ComE-like DNA-binding protein
MKISLPVIAFAAYWMTVGCAAAAADKDNPAGSPAGTPPASKSADKAADKAADKGKVAGSSAGTSKASQIDINTAGEEVLRKLEDINEERAKAIIKGRSAVGGGCYGTTAELLDRGILAKRVYDKIKDQVTASACGVSPSGKAATKADATK